MKLDQVSLADTPLFAQLVTEKSIGLSGALELLADDYKPPVAPFAKERCVLDDDEPVEIQDVESEPEAKTASVEERPDTETVKMTVIPEVNPNDEGFPAAVRVPKITAPEPPPPGAEGLRLIRPRTLADIKPSS